MTANSEHKKRWVAAVVGVAALAAIYASLGQLGLNLIVVAISFAAYFEFLTFSKSVTDPFSRWGAAAVGGALCAWLSFGLPGELPILAFAALLVSLRGLWSAHRQDGTDLLRAFLIVQARVFGLVYFAIFPAFVARLHSLPHGPLLLVFLLGIIWIGDTGAYYGGKTFGKKKLSQNISPGKTREGAISALLACALFAVLMQVKAFPHLPIWKMILISLATSLVAQAGDLIESMMKRAYGVKDSGSLIPGHGGVFDRFDSLLLAAPFFYVLVRVST